MASDQVVPSVSYYLDNGVGHFFKRLVSCSDRENVLENNVTDCLKMAMAQSPIR